MLKAQLHSKMFPIDAWRDVEDILTGDFFGALDYLPRETFVRAFIEELIRLNPSASSLDADGTKWKDVTFNFWPRITGEDEAAEPDLTIASDRWLLVVEVKLHSRLGSRQPWREYVVGRQIAELQGISQDAVRYVLVAPDRLDVTATFEVDQQTQCEQLLANTLQIRWSEIVALVERWLAVQPCAEGVTSEQTRLLNDLLAALQKRRRLAFGGFRFENFSQVLRPDDKAIFAPPRFRGFLYHIQNNEPSPAGPLWLSKYQGFMNSVPTNARCTSILLYDRFRGFQKSNISAVVVVNGLLVATRFDGFGRRFRPCRPQATFLDWIHNVTTE